MIRTSAGFTLIELIVVLVIIGILGAVALPRFFDLTVSAHDASVRATANNLDSAVNMARAQHEVEGRDGTITIDGSAVSFLLGTTGPTNSWPVGSSAASGGTLTAAGCVDIFNSLLEAGTFSTAGSLAGTTAGSVEYVASAAGLVCTYTYDKEDTKTRTITYDADDGDINVTIT